MFDQMIHDIHHWNRISQYFHMNYIKNIISKMSNLGKVNLFSPLYKVSSGFQNQNFKEQTRPVARRVETY